MKAKYLVLLFAVSLCLGCDASNSMLCYKSVVKEFPEGVIYTIPGEKYTFIVIDVNEDVYYVETLDATTPDVSMKFKLFNIKDKRR